MPARPMMMPPVGKSGPGTSSISSSIVRSGLSMSAIAASITSPRLWVGMLVAMPTAMPLAPLTRRFGKRAGSTAGSWRPAVVVGLELDRLLVDILEQRVGGARQARLGVAHRRRRIAVHRAVIALPVDERHAHGEILRHAHHRVVDRERRHAGDICPSPRRRCGPICGARGSSRSRPPSSRRGCGDAPASARRARRAARAPRSRSSRNRGRSVSSPLRWRRA